MPKRKGIVAKRLQWMLEGKRQRFEIESKMQSKIEGQSEGDDNMLDENVEVSSERSFHLEFSEGQDSNNQSSPPLDENLLIANSDVDFDDESDDDDNGEMVPEFVYIDGIPIPTKDLVYRRDGDGLILEVDSESEAPYLADFNGNYYDLWHVCGAVWETTAGVETQMTVGISTDRPAKWAAGAYLSGKRFVAKPTRRTSACRCVITAINSNLIMNPKKAFSFHLYVRTKVLAEKVKGLVRKATKAIHKAEAVDDLGELVPFHRYIERKMFNAKLKMPPFNRNAIQQREWVLQN